MAGRRHLVLAEGMTQPLSARRISCFRFAKGRCLAVSGLLIVPRIRILELSANFRPPGCSCSPGNGKLGFEEFCFLRLGAV